MSSPSRKMYSALAGKRRKQFGKQLLAPSELRQEHWRSLFKCAKTPRGFSNLSNLSNLNLGTRIGPIGGLSAIGGNTPSLLRKVWYIRDIISLSSFLVGYNAILLRVLIITTVIYRRRPLHHPNSSAK